MMQFDGPSQDDGLLASPPQQAGKFNTLFRKTSFRLLSKKKHVFKTTGVSFHERLKFVFLH